MNRKTSSTGSSSRPNSVSNSRKTTAAKKLPATTSMVPSASKSGRSSAVSRKQKLPFDMKEFPMQKMPDGSLAPKGYSMRPVVAAENYDVVSFARAMNDDFAPRVQKLFEPERKAALEAQKTGWRLPGQKFDCQRISDTSKCFCGHLLGEHDHYNGMSVHVPCKYANCRCRAFKWIPSRPEDIGEFWHQRRRNFDASTWRARCRCKHSHEEHDCNGMRRCNVRACSCSAFVSNFLCAACDKHWEEHDTFFETEAIRRKEGLPIGEGYLPFSEMPNLRNAVLTGDEQDDSVYYALTQGQGSIPLTQTPVGNDAVFQIAGNKKSYFRPVYD